MHLLAFAGLASMTWSKDVCGWLASGLVLGTFSVKSMRLLRIIGIGSNVAFISYGLLASTPPILVLHSLLLPINIYRLAQMPHGGQPRSRWNEPVRPPRRYQ
jgi:hypothetical protein